MKRKSRKILTWMLTAVCAVSLLTGCGSAKTGADENKGKNQGQSQSSQTDDTVIHNN